MRGTQLSANTVASPGMHGAGPLGVDEACARIVAAFSPLPPEELPLQDALNLVLAEDVVAGIDLPPFTNSAMDGYAIRAADTADALADAPARLRVTGQAAAGYQPDTMLASGCAVRIMTGAPLPEGADAVVRFEETDEDIEDGWVGIHRPLRPSENVRLAGEDVRSGASVLRAGARIRPAEIGLLAAIGRTHVVVHRRPRVGILVTGDEIVEPGQARKPGQIWNSNGPMVAAQVSQCGGDPVMLGVARDSVEAVRAKIAEASGVDLLVTTGGVSVGDFDIVKDVLQSEGQIDLWQIRIKPGKPLAFGWIGDTPLIGLPGNPVAAAVAFAQFARPAILAMLGHRDPSMPTIQARLLDRIENHGGRTQFVRVRVQETLSGYVAWFAGSHGSAALTALAEANGLLVVPESCAVAEPGEVFTVQMTDWVLD